MPENNKEIEGYDVLVVGAGGAGVTAAICAAKAGARVAIVAKDQIGYGNTRISGGGFVSENVPSDLIRDVIRSGAGLSDEASVRVMAEEAQEAVATIVRFGQIFRTDPEGQFIAAKRGGHSKERNLRSPNSGVSMAQALRGAIARLQVDLFEDTMVCQLLQEKDKDKRIIGAIAYDVVEGRLRTLYAPAVVLATGGAGWLFYPHTDNIKTVSGDGYALALTAGASLIDMEQVQFLPFAVVYPESMRGLYAGEPSAVGGPRGVLRSADGGFVMDQLDKKKRDEVSNAVFNTIRQGPVTEHGGVLLDLSGNRAFPLGSPELRNWSRPFEAVRMAYGRDAFFGKEPFEVQPTVHHMMGGIWTDTTGCSEVPGLFAAGEARGGVHGANRLSGMALLDNIVFGRRAGQSAAVFSASNPVAFSPQGEGAKTLQDQVRECKERKRGERAAGLKREITGAVWHAMGGPRSEERIRSSLERMTAARVRIPDCVLAPQQRWNMDVLDFLELRLMVLPAEAILRSALIRQESRGAHVWEEKREQDVSFTGKRTRVTVKNSTMVAQWKAV